jgi:SAM-dependent methyltransferase
MFAERDNAPTRELYEELPYPGDGVVRTPVARNLRRALAEHRPDLLHRPGLRILDVGCGTGESTVGISRLFPRAHVVGIDVNEASLTRARELAQRMATGVRILRCDIVDELPLALTTGPLVGEQAFDVVVSSGVLHHLSDPSTGFRAVRRVVRDDGLFLCWVYSRYGRWDDQAVKALAERVVTPSARFSTRADAIRHLGLAKKHTPAAFLRTLSVRMRFGPPIAPLELLRVYLRRNQATHVADTYANPCEHYFAFADLETLVERTGWRCRGLARGFGMPTTPDEHTRDPEVLTLLRNIPRSALYDYFAYAYGAWGFGVLLDPAPATVQ